MTEKSSYTELYIDFRKSQEKFDYFFLGITIGLLSLSIQMFDPEKIYQSPYLITIAWMLLLISLSTGFFSVTQILRFKRIDLEKKANEKLAAKYLDTYQGFIIRAKKCQIASFYLALVFYALFKITNIYCMPYYFEIIIIICAMLIGGLLSFLYNRRILKIEKEN